MGVGWAWIGGVMTPRIPGVQVGGSWVSGTREDAQVEGKRLILRISRFRNLVFQHNLKCLTCYRELRVPVTQIGLLSALGPIRFILSPLPPSRTVCVHVN